MTHCGLADDRDGEILFMSFFVEALFLYLYKSFLFYGALEMIRNSTYSDTVFFSFG